MRAYFPLRTGVKRSPWWPPEGRVDWPAGCSAAPTGNVHRYRYVCLTSSVVGRNEFILFMPLSVTVFNEETFQSVPELTDFETGRIALQNHLQKQIRNCNSLRLMKRNQKGTWLLLGWMFPLHVSQPVHVSEAPPLQAKSFQTSIG